MKSYLRKNRLVNAVLTSTLFLTPLVGSATQIIDTVINHTVSTNTPEANGSIIILPTGQVDPNNNDGIRVNLAGVQNFVSIEPSNIHGANAVLINNNNGKGIFIQSLGAIVNIGAGSGVTIDNNANNDQAIVMGASATVNNAGTVQVLDGSGEAIRIDGANATLNNLVNGTIQNGATKRTILDRSLGNTIINNAGLISNASPDPVIIFSHGNGGSFNVINNNAGGVIVNTTGTAINVRINDGQGDIVNHVGGTIQAGTGLGSNAVLIEDDINDIINDGLMIASNGNTISLINGSTINQIINSGDLINTDTSAVIGATPGVTITKSLINRGNITSIPGAGGRAIDFSGDVNAFISQEAGTITGDVLLGHRGDAGFVLRVRGGVIEGDILTNDTVDFSILSFSGGAVMGTVNLNGPEGDLVVLSGDAFVDRFVDNSALAFAGYIVRGGFFNEIDRGIVVQIESSVTFGNPATDTMLASNGIVKNVPNIFIVNPGTVFTDNAPILNTRQLVVVPDTTFVPNNLVHFIDGPGVVNRGTIIVNGPQVDGKPVIDFSAGGIWLNKAGEAVLTPTGVMTVLGDNTENVFQDHPGSALVVQMAGPMGGPVVNGQLVVDSQFAGQVVDLQAGSFIKPQFSGFIPDSQVFNVITVNDGQNVHGYIHNAATMVQSSAVVFFTPRLVDLVTDNIIEGQVLQLISHRNPFSAFAHGPTNGVTDALDFFAQGAGPTTADFFTLITQLDQLPTGGAVNEAMKSLIPPFNYGLIEGSHIGMDSMFEGVTDRVWDVAWHHSEYGRRHHGRHQGVNAGDDYYFSNGGVWLRPIAAYVSQNERDDVEGYRAKAVGGALGVDLALDDCRMFGLALSYTHVNVDDKNFAPKDERINSWMGIVYGSFDFEHGIFLDTMLAGAHNDYKTNRVIAVNNLLTAAQASFDGSQWGVQGDLGISLPTNQPMFFAPFVRLKYIYLSIDDYTENGAGDLNLDVSFNNAKEFLGGVGVRMATDFVAEGILWVPELMVMFAYDFDNDGEVSVANFIGGGPAFETHGVIPGRAIFDTGIALNALIGNCSVITAKYNLELRENFAANSAYLQYYFNFA